MFQPKSRNEQIFEFAVTVAEAPPDDFRAQLLAVLCRLSADQWAVLADVARQYLEEVAATAPPKKEADPD